MTNTRSGDCIVKLPDAHTAQKVLSNISDSTTCSAMPLPKLSPKLTILQVEKEMQNKEIIESIKLKNSHITELIKSEDDFTILFAYKLSDHHKTIVIKTTASIRAAIMSTGLLYVGTRRCRVYDRYWVNRCNRCQSYKHKTADCKSQLACGFCAGNHQSRECNNRNQLRCKNCQESGHMDYKHASISHDCPIYSSIKSYIISRTDTDCCPKN